MVAIYRDETEQFPPERGRLNGGPGANREGIKGEAPVRGTYLQKTLNISNVKGHVFLAFEF